MSIDTKTKKIFSLFFLSIIIASVFSFVLAPAPASAAFVPCGRNVGTPEETAPCTLCHLLIGFQTIVLYARNLATALALLAVTLAGIMYVISAGDQEMMGKAKGFIKSSVIGFAVVFGAWLIVSLTLWIISAKPNLGVSAINWYTFKCETASSVSVKTTCSGPKSPDGCTSASKVPICQSGYTISLSMDCANSEVCCTESSKTTCGASGEGECLGAAPLCPFGKKAIDGDCRTWGETCCTK